MDDGILQSLSNNPEDLNLHIVVDITSPQLQEYRTQARINLFNRSSLPRNVSKLRHPRPLYCKEVHKPITQLLNQLYLYKLFTFIFMFPCKCQSCEC